MSWLKLFLRRKPPAEAAALVPPLPAPAPTPASSPPASIACFHLATSEGHHLAVSPDVADGWCAVVARELDPACAVIALVPASHPFACVLIAANAAPFGIGADGAPRRATSGRLIPTNVRGICRIKHPVGGMRFLAASGPGTPLVFNDAGRTMQAAIGFTPVPQTELTASAFALATACAKAFHRGLTADALLLGLAQATLPAELAEPLARLLCDEELDELGRRLLQGGPDLPRLARAVPADPWLNTALPTLAAWHARGRPPAEEHLVISPAGDEAQLLPIMEAGHPSAAVSAGLALHALARRHVLPRRTACLLTTVRNEGPYLLDWISYHLAIGFEHIFLYTNDNTDGSDTLLDALSRGGAITLIRNACGPKIGAQQKAYAHGLTMLPQVLDFRWTAILDLDEYLAFDTNMFRNVHEFIAFHEAQPVDAIVLCWVVFAALSGDRWSEASPAARFTRRVRETDKHVKSLFRTRQFWSSHPHYPHATLGAPSYVRTEDGQLHGPAGQSEPLPAWAEHPSANFAWVNHYLLKTAEEAVWKWSRGRADWKPDAIAAESPQFLRFVSEKFLELSRPEQLTEDRRILACAKGQGRGQGAVRDSLMSLPGVAEEQAGVMSGFSARLAANTNAFLALGASPDEPHSVRHFRDLLAARVA